MITATNIHYEQAKRARGLSAGGIGAILLLAQKIELDKEIDRTLHLLKRHLPYHESDHVLNIAFNILVGGTRIEHLELRRNDEVYLDALGAERIPDPTTAGDFCRRFTSEAEVVTVMNAINKARLRVWAQQPDEFFNEAILDADGTIAQTEAECKKDVDIGYNGKWGYHVHLVSLANTGEPLYLLNRSGNRPSQEQAGEYLNKGVACAFGPASARSCSRRHEDRREQRPDLGTSRSCRGTAPPSPRPRIWIPGMMRGISASSSDMRPMNASRPRRRAAAHAYSFLERPPRYTQATPRQQPERPSRRLSETEATGRSICSKNDRRVRLSAGCLQEELSEIVLRKRLATDKGQMRLFEEYRYFFYITNDRDMSAEDVVFSANDRCNQENLIAQLKSGVHALTTPVDNLVSNWAYMVMASLAWSLKAWSACWCPYHPGMKRSTRLRNEPCCGWSSRRSARLSSRCRVRSCGVDDG